MDEMKVNRLLTPQEMAQDFLDILRRNCNGNPKLMAKVAEALFQELGEFPKENQK